MDHVGCLFKLSNHSTICFILITFFVFMQTGVLSLISMGTAQNVHKYIEYSRIVHFHHKKGGADMFKALQHIKTKSYKLRTNLVDFGGTAQKEQLVYLA